MNIYTLVYPYTEFTKHLPIPVLPAVLLAQQVSGMWKGYINGFGGKIEDEETKEACAVRELREESGISCEPHELIESGVIDFLYPQPEMNSRVFVFTVEIDKDVKRLPLLEFRQWYTHDNIPYAQMPPYDHLWLPFVIRRKFVRACILMGMNGEPSKIEYDIHPIGEIKFSVETDALSRNRIKVNDA